MQQSAQYGAFRALGASREAFARTTRSSLRFSISSERKQIWTCAECRVEQRQKRQYARLTTSHRAVIGSQQPFSSVARRFQDLHNKFPSSKASDLDIGSHAPQTPASNSKALPSHSEKQRWTVSRQLAALMDELLTRASVASQHINSYTGTDYTGIEALRTEISEQETTVKNHHSEVTEAKSRHKEAQQQQSSSQKEIVGLLERKSSWSPVDLERYMSLVRSEHLDEQTEQKAREGLGIAERQLEHSRSLLEKLERKQYHEEQIWSDTIRRNSTWVTMVLMGVNILLLLAQISVFEPYRRRKIVSQIEAALDERSLARPTLGPHEHQTLEHQGDVAVGPTTVTSVRTDDLMSSERESHQLQQSSAAVPQEPLTDLAPVELVESKADSDQSSKLVSAHSVTDTVASLQVKVRDLFSERVVQLKMMEITTIALQGAVIGLGAAALFWFVLLRPSP